MKVYLVRHAEAQQGHPDRLRELTATGKEDAKLLGQKLAQRQIRVDEIVHSGFNRAMQTADIICQELGLHGAKHGEELTPSSSPNYWGKKLEQHQLDIMLVGHMPYMSLLVENLTNHQDTVIFQSPQVVCLEHVGPGAWQILWKESV